MREPPSLHFVFQGKSDDEELSACFLEAVLTFARNNDEISRSRRCAVSYDETVLI